MRPEDLMRMLLASALVTIWTGIAAAQAKNEDDIREAAIRYALTHFEAPDLTKVTAIILDIDGDIPSDEFLRRFAKDKPPVRSMPRSLHRELKETELSCRVDNLKWVSEAEAEISASRVIGVEAVSFSYTLHHTNKGWHVIQYRITGIS